jgi:hypothetical protein
VLSASLVVPKKVLVLCEDNTSFAQCVRHLLIIRRTNKVPPAGKRVEREKWLIRVDCQAWRGGSCAGRDGKQSKNAAVSAELKRCQAAAALIEAQAGVLGLGGAILTEHL